MTITPVLLCGGSGTRLWPVSRNNDPDAMMLVCPSDHLIPDDEGFRETILRAQPAAQAGQIVTFGIRPTYAETGYGYLELAGNPADDVVPLARFIEKSDAETAAALVASGQNMWNAGIFLFKASTMIDAFRNHCSDMLEPVQTAAADAQVDLGFLRLAPAAWAKAENISIDYAVMERAENLSVAPYHGPWSDLGGWDAVWRESVQDEKGVALSGNATAIDCTNSLLRSESDGLELVGIGLDNIVAIAMNDAVLVADARRGQDVKLAVQALKKRGATQAEQFPKDHRPWGWFESLAIGTRFQVKRIVVHPGAALSLQSHHHRSEHWIVVEGTAKVTINEKIDLVSENQSVYIPLGATHRMENPGKVPMVLIEVQTGACLGEDDIIRYEDVYARGQGAKG